MFNLYSILLRIFICKKILINKFSILSLLLFCLISLSCGTTRKSITESPKDFKNNISIPIAPGTAKLQAILLKVNEEDDEFVCVFKVREVNGYGAATPHLPVGTEINVFIPKEYLQTNGYSAEQILEKNNQYELTIKNEQRMYLESQNINWSIISINKNEKYMEVK